MGDSVYIDQDEICRVEEYSMGVAPYGFISLFSF